MNIAILMSTYNGEKYLPMQLDSLASQTVSEYITVYIRDDGSKDNTVKIIESYKDKINLVLYKEHNLGPAKSFWNLFNKEIDADYFLFCDQDDIWDPDKTQKLIEGLKDGCSLAACNCRIIDSSGHIKASKRVMNPPKVSIPRLFVAGFTQGCSIAFTRQVRDFIIDSNIKRIPMHDIIIILYALSIGTIRWIDTPLFSYRVHEGNVVAKNNSIFKKLKTTIWNWNNSAHNSMSDVAWELLQKGKNLSFEDISYLCAMANYRKSIINKHFLIFYKNLCGVDQSCLRSYRVRIIFNLL